MLPWTGQAEKKKCFDTSDDDEGVLGAASFGLLLSGVAGVLVCCEVTTVGRYGTELWHAFDTLQTSSGSQCRYACNPHVVTTGREEKSVKLALVHQCIGRQGPEYLRGVFERGI